MPKEQKDDKFQICEPITELPNTGIRRYSQVYQAVGQLKKDEWLPVAFASGIDAQRFQSAVCGLRTRAYIVRVRGAIAYIREREREEHA